MRGRGRGGRGRGRGRSRSVSDLPGPQRHACVDHAVLGGPAARSAVWPPFRPRPIHWHPQSEPTAHPTRPLQRLPNPEPGCASARTRTFCIQRQPTNQPPPRAVTWPTTLPFQTTSHHHHCDPPRPCGNLRLSHPPRAAHQHLFTTDGTCNVHAATAPPQRNETKASERRHRPATRKRRSDARQHRLKRDDGNDAAPSRCTQQSDTSNRARPRSRSSARRRPDGTVRPFARSLPSRRRE